MNTKSLAAVLALLFPCIALSAETGTDQKAMMTALEKYLAKQGDFCLGKFDWPVDVSEAEFSQSTKNALQMPVLEKVGLVKAETVDSVKRYVLTEDGRKFYLEKTSTTMVEDKKIEHSHDLCAAKLSLNKIVRWEDSVGDDKSTTVFYTYKVVPTKWAQDADVQKAFPMLARILQGEGKLELQQRFRLAGASWQPVGPWE